MRATPSLTEYVTLEKSAIPPPVKSIFGPTQTLPNCAKAPQTLIHANILLDLTASFTTFPTTLSAQA
jgi:hypothetical protein